MILDDICKKAMQKTRWHANVVKKEYRQRVVLTIIIFTATLMIAIFVPTVGSIIALLGGISAVFIFIYPGKPVGCVCGTKAHILVVML